MNKNTVKKTMDNSSINDFNIPLNIIDEIVLNRARGHTISKLDPVSAGKHCCIGLGDYDNIVTSTINLIKFFLYFVKKN